MEQHLFSGVSVWLGKISFKFAYKTIGKIGWLPNWMLADKIDLPNLYVNPETIFSNRIPLLDIDIMDPSIDSAAHDVQKLVSSWYITFRNIAIIGLLSVLLYIGIRILIASASADKAKYKNMLKDWFVAFCLLFFMHYIMSFSITAVKFLTKEITQEKQSTGYAIEGLNIDYLRTEYLLDNINLSIAFGEAENFKKEQITFGQYLENKTDSNGDIPLNYMELIRFNAQASIYGTEDGEAFAYTIMYLVLIIYTVWFLFIYAKRLVYIILLTMIAPLVALSYPLDKMRDGSAQGFNVWLKEYIFNLLIQPLHLILYYVLIESATDLVVEGYVIYPLIVLGFFLQAEKVLRKLFGFDKATTASTLFSGVMGGAAVMSGINWLSRGAKGIGKVGGKSSSGESSKGVRTADSMDNRKADKDYKITDGFAVFDKEPDDPKTSGKNDSPDTSKDKKTSGKSKDKAGQKAGNAKKDTNIINRARIELSNQNGDDIYDPNPGLYHFANRGEERDYNLNNLEYSSDIPENELTSDNIRMKDMDISGEDSGASSDIRFEDNSNDEFDENEEEENPSIRENNSNDDNTEDWQGGLSALAHKYLPNDSTRVITGVAKGIAKGAAFTYGAATLGSIGIAAGLASDNIGNVAKYGLAGAAAGAGVGSSLANTITKTPDIVEEKYDEAEDIYKKGALSKEQYQKWLNQRADAQFLRNKDIQFQVEKEFGRENVKEAMNAMLEYRRYGFTDTDLIIKAMKNNISEMDEKTGKYKEENKWFDKRKVYALKLGNSIRSPKGLKELKKTMQDKKIVKDQINGVTGFIRQVKNIDY